MADTNEQERFDPTRLIGRVTVVVLALAGAALVLLPSTMYGWEANVLDIDWTARPTLFVLNTAALFGCAIALAVGFAREAHPAARLLGAAYGFGACAWGLMSADAGSSITNVAVSGNTLAACAALAAFCTRFPRTVTKDDHRAFRERIEKGLPSSDLVARDDPFRLIESPFDGWAKWVGLLKLHELTRSIERRFGLNALYDESWLSDAMPHQVLINGWLIVAACIPVTVILQASLQPDVWLVPFAFGMYVGLLSFLGLRVVIAVGAPEDRRRALWIAAGIVGAFMVVLLALVAMFVAFLIGYSQYGLGHLGLVTLANPIAALAFVIGTAIAVFGSGDLDPNLAIKRTLVTGIVATLLTFMFALVEGLVATLLADQVGLPSSAAPAIASAVVAVALGPMWRKTSSWVGGKFGVSVVGHDPA